MPRVRPQGLAVIALLLAWVGVSLILLALARPVRTWTADFWPVYLALAVVHGILAWLAAFGLWELRPWARRAFGCWALAALTGVALPFFMPRPSPVRWGLLVGALLLFALLLVPLTRYILRVTESPR